MTDSVHCHVPAGPPPEPAATPDTPSWRLVSTLGVAGALAGLLVVMVYRWTLAPIEAHKGLVVQQAVAEVLEQPSRLDTLYLERGALTRQPEGNRSELPVAYLGYDAGGRRIGAAITAAEPGFTDVITLMLGFDPESGRIIGMKVLDQKETPGLGEKIEKDSAFVAQWHGLVPPLRAVKKASPGATGEVQAISGATISSRAVTRIINNALDKWRPLLTAYRAGATP
jgi:electron transport complex protein RnfG